jgi:tetratricopeptide (TPR) repeat protein
LWAGKFDGALGNIFDLQDRIVASVIGAIEPSLRGAEIERARRKRPDDLNAYDLYLRALSHVYTFTPKGQAAALELLGKALEINPNYVEAHGVAAACYTQRVWTQPEFATDLASALSHTRAIMSIKTDDASTLAFAAITYATATRDYETAIQMIEHALAHNPSSAAAQSVGAVVNAWAGNHETAVSLAERSLRFSPFEPTRHLALAALSRSRLFQGNPEAALAAARGAVQATPGHLPSHGYVIICLTRLGRLQERDATVERMLASFPSVRLSHFLAHSTFAPFDNELAAAGLPL